MRIFLLSTLFSISFCQSFIIPQRPIFNLLKWEEINSDQILIKKVGPIVNTTLNPSEITSFYYSDSKSKRILTGEIFPEFSINNSDGSRIRFYGSAAITLSERLTIQNEFEFDNKGENDPHFQGVERGFKNGWVGYLQHSSLTYNYLRGHLSIGRGNPYFFNMNESLLLNPNFPPAEYVWWQHAAQWFQYDWGFLMLNEIQIAVDTVNRFLTFHRYGINNDKWRVGVTEAVLVNYDVWSSEEIEYLIPTGVILETEANNGVNANLIWMLDGLYKNNNWTIYTEFIVDDFAIDGKSPPQIAGSIGFGRKYKHILLNVEYTRINRWVGNHCDTSNIWIDGKVQVPIGHKLGPNAHKLQIESFIFLNKKLSFNFLMGLVEHGDGTANQRLVESWPKSITCDENFGYGREDRFPSESNISFYYHFNTYYLYRKQFMINLFINKNINTEAILTMTLKI